MTRYGFAIKALPKGSKPFGDEDKDQEQDAPPGGSADADVAAPSADSATAPAEDAPDSADEEVPEAEPSDETGPTPVAAAAPLEDESADPAPGPEDDARPWSGDMYDEGDETDPADAFAAYKGANGEEAWLDQAPDGTLTGWVRDPTGQVWKYVDPDVWAIDVDDAQMTRTHSQANGDGGGNASAEHGGQDPLFPPKQS
ncbi:hypothetical protein [Streptomyces sp. NRRL S-146]|uniref:hypothetical protein n=1 Tax=Streptomyces sp. NRRL S-146 TaxID=1463884 RepID=UPI0004C5388B|nr:hypothetical protein [Streptomyces sp. NRRL S-146]